MNMFLGMKIVARILYSFFLEVGFFLWYSSLFVSSAKLNVSVIVSLSGSFKNI